ncbi:Uncharacterised protein [Mycobacteroides abscessus subsp. massiliense]|uniref:hypothetical protein n=1 Tax=Mycobacteroides abscessus TaxID=36809 RepID=UPI0009C7ECA4|nr:hypothetical protein [Mycobacteroides abscessus]SLC05444.1 Uncharacterised protein [Mycobacteroides abscessus subsp. massiliense]
MSLSVALTVNGQPIGRVEINCVEWSQYTDSRRYEYSITSSDRAEPESGHIDHYHRDGALTLLHKVLADYLGVAR